MENVNILLSLVPYLLIGILGIIVLKLQNQVLRNQLKSAKDDIELLEIISRINQRTDTSFNDSIMEHLTVQGNTIMEILNIIEGENNEENTLCTDDTNINVDSINTIDTESEPTDRNTKSN